MTKDERRTEAEKYASCLNCKYRMVDRDEEPCSICFSAGEFVCWEWMEED